MAFDPILPLYFGYFFKLHNQYHFGYILACRIRGVTTYNVICYVKELGFRFNNRDLSTGEMVYKIVKALMNFTPSDD